MHILIATDSFKESLNAEAVCAAIESGLAASFPEATLTQLPLADGGEGSLAAISKGKTKINCPSTNALGQAIDTYYITDEHTAYIEMALASGLELLTDEQKNPDNTSTYGTGLLIADAIKNGFKNIVLFVGGSATNDGGMGMAVALGYTFFDEAGQELAAKGENLIKIRRIVKPPQDFTYLNVIVATDVENPLYGPQGAAYTFAAQKGASPLQIVELDNGLKNLADVIQKDLDLDVAQLPGAGAAGGLGAGAAVFLGATIQKGTDLIFETLGLKKAIAKADVIITGEGKIDSQTGQGKLVSRIFDITNNKKVIVITGGLLAPDYLLSKPNLLYASAIANAPMALAFSKQNAEKLLMEKGMFLGKMLQQINFK